MGSRMAARLLAAGYPMTVYNRDVSKTTPLTERGAAAASTPADAARQAEIVISMLADDGAVRAVLLGAGGAIAAMQPGTILVEMSTVSPDMAREIAAAAKARGIAALDSPVAGSTPQAEEGSLLIFVGGEADTLDLCRPVLLAVGKSVTHMGPNGTGVTMKVINNTLLGLGLQAVAEAIALGVKSGLDPAQLLDVLGQSTVVAPAHKGKLQNARTGEYPANFPLRLMHKDLGLALGLAAQNRVPMPATAVAQQICAAELAKDVEEDFSVTIRLMQEMAGI